MLAKITNQETKQVIIGTGTNTNFYQSIGMIEMEVEQAYNGCWYVKGYAPQKTVPTNEEQRQLRANEYAIRIDPITAHISRLRDEEQTDDVVSEIEKLKQERAEMVEQIKAEFPYFENNEVHVPDQENDVNNSETID